MGTPLLVDDLLRIGAVQIMKDDYFTWTSGIRSPIYCDNRLTMSYPSVRKRVAQALEEEIRAFTSPIDVIAGCATAGIPHAAWVAEQMELPMVYVRSSAKKHGKGNQIEGEVAKGARAIVIEDLISTGKSSIEAAEALRKQGVEVIAVLSIFSYNLTIASEAFASYNLIFKSLATYDELLRSMREDEKLTEDELNKLTKWKHDPEIFTQT